MGRWARWQVYLFWAAITVSLLGLAPMGIDLYLDRELHLAPLLLGNAVLIACASALYTARSRALDRLRETARSHRLVTEEASDPIFLTDYHTTHFLDANRRACALTGYSPDELKATRALDVIEVERAEFKRMATVITVGDVYRGEQMIVRKDGVKIPIELSASRISEDVVQSIVRPIGERKAAEETLRRSEAVFRAVSELTSDYVFSMKVESDGSLTPEWLTGAYERVTGYTVEGALARPKWEPLAHPDDFPAVVRTVTEGIRRGGAVTTQYRIVTKSGDVRHVRAVARFERDDPDGPVVRIVGAVSDITEQRRLEADLGESERRYKNLYERLPIGIYRGVLRGPLVEANPACVAMFGYPDETAFLAVDPGELYVDREDRNKWLRYLEDPGVAVNYEIHYKRRDGSTFWGRNTARLVRDEKGEAWIEGALVDITEEKLLDIELRATLNSLRRADAERRRLLTHLVKAKEEERHRVASDIHDDSVQVMTAVAIDLERFARNAADPDKRRALEELEARVRDAVGRLRTMVFELRPPTLDQEGVLSALGLYLEEFSIDTGIRYELVSHLDAEPSRATRVVLYRIAQEALTNVRKHSAATRVGVSLEPRESGIAMLVTDDGQGFDVSSDDLVAPGHIGLSEMRERAEISGGRFDIRSEVGRGTTVDVWIPELSP